MKSRVEILEEIAPYLQVGVSPKIACGLIKITISDLEDALDASESLMDYIERCKEEGIAIILVSQFALAVNQKNPAMLKHLGEVVCKQKTHDKSQLKIEFTPTYNLSTLSNDELEQLATIQRKLGIS